MKLTLSLLAGMAAIAMLTLATAGCGKTSQAEMTITGEGKCAKCVLHESDTCQIVITVGQGAQTSTYYLTPNAVSAQFHDNVSKEAKKVTAVGTLSRANDKLVLTAKKIDLAN